MTETSTLEGFEGVEVAPAEVVQFSLKVRNLDYSHLTADRRLIGRFESSVREVVLGQVGNGVTPEDLFVSISAGSVIAHCGIRVPEGVAARDMQASVEDVATTALPEALEERLSSDTAFEAAITGPVRVALRTPPALLDSPGLQGGGPGRASEGGAVGAPLNWPLIVGDTTIVGVILLLMCLPGSRCCAGPGQSHEAEPLGKSGQQARMLRASLGGGEESRPTDSVAGDSEAHPLVEAGQQEAPGVVQRRRGALPALHVPPPPDGAAAPAGSSVPALPPAPLPRLTAVQQEKVDQVVALGFDEAAAHTALEAAGWSVEAACEHLLAEGHAGGAAASAAASASREPPASGAGAPLSPTSAAREADQKLQQVMEMGFDKVQAQSALAAHQWNVQSAVNALMAAQQHH